MIFDSGLWGLLTDWLRMGQNKVVSECNKKESTVSRGPTEYVKQVW